MNQGLIFEIPIERSLNVVEARQSLERSLKAHGLNWTIEFVGKHIITTKCTLRGQKGQFLDYGYGKGEKESSLTGAMFEAAEHYFSRFSNSNKHNVIYRESSEYLETTRFAEYLPISIIRNCPSAKMAFREYCSLEGSEQILYPVALSDPKYIDERYDKEYIYDDDEFDYSKIEGYSSNSGTAIGSSELESIIHGLSEAVERDSLSTFLVRAFLKRERNALRVIKKNSLPDSLATLVIAAEAEIEQELILLEIKNDFDIPTFISTIKTNITPVGITGFGCSLSAEHAARRSVYELVQCYHARQIFYPTHFAKKEKAILAKFNGHPFHQRCAALQIAEWCEQIGSATTNFASSNVFSLPIELDKYLELLQTRIQSAGRQTYSAIVNILEEGQIITHNIIEGQDHFFCVTEGAFVLPNSHLLI
jgi:ribosomal protein S12 methylthiotransferase accessory factor